ncbi:DNA polymerase IV [Ornithinimicrobium faecis]|uniref:DNA polymerase IV n=1 Tax=Ornithinimicrobium faecis TaxID=2934158 RepID=A0ABY4YZI9_9MICO|nr:MULTISPECIES: DNA polymerase IV [unclassified Ornithinimicrobium]USQ82150.1 DNA polymerase IV [Ornithinimicrobium sp. HY1793]
MAPPPGAGVDDRGCTILHVDMDAFYASASLIARPELVGTPVVIGGGMRSVVLSATYEARAYGIRSGMPMARARRLCPQAEIVRPDYDLYSAISAAVMAVFSEVTHQVEPVSMEEAFLDVSTAQRRLGSPAQIGQWIRDTIADEQQITCSVGGAPTKVVAKMASNAAKPDGMLMIPPHKVVDFLHPLPVSALWGVGESTEAALHRLGLRTVADIAHLPHATLSRAMGTNGANHLQDLAWGRDTGRVTTTRVERSVGSSETFHQDVDDPAVIRRQLLRLSDRSATRMRHSGMLTRTVVLTVRFSDFTTITRSRTMRESTDVTRDIFGTATALYAALGLQRARIRLLGVRLEGLTDAADTPVQGMLDEPERGWRDAERAMDRAVEKFGSGIVRPASLVVRDEARGDHEGRPRPERGPQGARGPWGAAAWSPRGTALARR